MKERGRKRESRKRKKRGKGKKEKTGGRRGVERKRGECEDNGLKPEKPVKSRYQS